MKWDIPNLILLMPVMSVIALLLQQGHLLMSLLCLEGITLSLVLMVTLTLHSCAILSSALSVVILTFGACEASLGLSLLVAMSRTYGSDLTQSLTSNKC